MQDLDVSDFPTENYRDQPNDLTPDMPARPLPYGLRRTLDLTKHYRTHPRTQVLSSVPARQWMGEPYEYRTTLSLTKRCQAILSYPDYLGESTQEWCDQPAVYRATHHQGYPLPTGLPGNDPHSPTDFRVCSQCARDDDMTTFVHMYDHSMKLGPRVDTSPDESVQYH